MKVTNAHLKIAIFVLFGILALYAVLKLAFHVAFGSFIEENLPLAVIIGAVVIFGWNRQIYDRDQKELKAREDAAEAEKKPQTPAT